MPKYKIQRSAPDTCELTPIEYEVIDPIEGLKIVTKYFGCIYIETYDVLLPPGSRVVTIASIERVCIAHVVGTEAAKGKLLWHDGNWKDHDKYIKYQQDWFLWLNVQQWNARKVAGLIPANEPLMEELLPFRIEPTTSGTVSIPPAQEVTDLQTIYDWNIENNARLGDSLEIIKTETTNEKTHDLSTHRWELAGDSRLLYINTNQNLAVGTISRIQSDADIQFGIDKVVIEG